MIKRLFDIFFSFLALLGLLPVFIVIIIIMFCGSGVKFFYLQRRVGKNNKDFTLFKFRTMYPDSDKKGLITVGERDNRITPLGFWLRKYKLDELPQIINVLIGDMSIVGPRPEVRKYVNLYNKEQLKVLDVRPGITDYASIEFVNENEILGKAEEPMKVYVEKIMPHKLELNLKYIKKHNIFIDLKIIFRTFLAIFR